MGGWNSAEYQRSNNDRNEDKGRSAGQGMEAKGETMSDIYYSDLNTLKDHWTIRERKVDAHKCGSVRDIGTYRKKSEALAALWKMRAESRDEIDVRLVKRRLITATERSWRAATQAKRIANALINYAVDNSAQEPNGGYRSISTDVILDFAQEIMDGKR